MLHRLVAATVLATQLQAMAAADVVTYDFSGYTYVGGSLRQFTGVFQYEDSSPSSSVYFNGQNGPLQQGFRSSYYGSVRQLSISLPGGPDDDPPPAESVTTVPGGFIDVNNIQQAEAGSQVPEGMTVQAYAGAASGTINGVAIGTLYLAFLPQPPGFSWNDLDTYFDGNAETLLQNNPGLLPTTINPLLTGTPLTPSIQQLATSLFLGTIHQSPQGVTTTVNTITSFTLREPPPPVPACSLADVASLGGVSTSDGVLTIDDVVVFLGAFFAGNAMADVASLGGVTGPDGQLTVDDLVVFLAAFFSGCP